MRDRFLLLTMMLAAGGGAAGAQDGLRSAALPGPAPSQAAPGSDLFAVGSDFYRRAPEPRRDLPPIVLPYAWPGPYWYPPPAGVHREPRPVHAAKGAAARPAHRPAAPVITQPPLPPGPPKTFYVIPGCYAGDRRPEPERLPAGCDMSRLRVVPPR